MTEVQPQRSSASLWIEKEEAAAAEAARIEAEAQAKRDAIALARQTTKDALTRSIRLSGPKRKKLLRDLQVQWHPDKQLDSGEATRELASELSQLINEAMAKAKANAKARGEEW